MDLIKRLSIDKSTRKKLIMTNIILFVLLIGYRIPLPGINAEFLKSFHEAMKANGAGAFLNALTGNSFSQMSIFALSIAPYISASIIVQLLTVCIPALERISKDGAVGREKIEKLTYILGVVVAFVQALGLAIGIGQQGLFTNYNAGVVIYASIVWTLGACFLMWVGTRIKTKFIGNGISLILLFNILTTLPNDMINLYSSITYDETTIVKVFAVIGIILMAIFVYAYVVVLEKAEKRIKTLNSRKMGKTMANANDNIMPIKLNMGGVMPIIFSSSIMSLPPIITSLLHVDANSIWFKISMCFNQSSWFDPHNMVYTLGVLLYIPLTFLFSYFYSMISFNTQEIADNLRKSGSVIAGIRPGDPTVKYLDKQVKSMLGIGTAMLLGIALLPTLISGIFHIHGLGFGGTTILIIVGVILEMRETLMSQTSTLGYKKLIKRKK